jgi:hypothetical protein
MEDIINSIDTTLIELEAHIEILLSVRERLNGKNIDEKDLSILESDLFQLYDSVEEFGAHVSNIMYYVDILHDHGRVFYRRN